MEDNLLTLEKAHFDSLVITLDGHKDIQNRIRNSEDAYDNGQPTRNSSETVKNAFRFVLEARRRGFNVELSEAFGYLGPLESYARSTPFFCDCGWNTFCLNPEGEEIADALYSQTNEGKSQVLP